MKKTILSLFAIMPFVFNSPAKAMSVDDMARGVLGTLSKSSNKICHKANVLSKTFTLRSFNGNLCKIKPFAMLAAHVCQGIDDFESSHCYKNIKSSFPTLLANEPVEKVAEESINILSTNEGKKNKEAICNNTFISKLSEKISKDHSDKRYKKIEEMVEVCKKEGVSLTGIF